MERLLSHLAWPEVQRAALRPGSTVVWPFGAIEQHGPQLPLGTDGLFSERILDAVLERIDAAAPLWRLPLWAFGFSPEHQGFPGTLSLPAELLISMVVSLGGDLARAGFERLILFNGHGGQIALLQVAARQLRANHPELAVLPCFLWSGADGLEELVNEPERSEGLHAGLLETSLMMHLAPELVGPERPDDGHPPTAPNGWSLEGALPCAWLTSDLSRSGVIGDSRLADAALGASLEQKLITGWQQRLEALLASDWPPRQPHADG